MASPSHTHASAESARTAGHKSCLRSWRLHEPNAMRRSPRWSSGVVVVAGSSPGVLTWSPLAAPATIARNARSPKTVRIVALRHGGTVMTILFSTRTEYTSRCATGIYLGGRGISDGIRQSHGPVASRDVSTTTLAGEMRPRPFPAPPPAPRGGVPRLFQGVVESAESLSASPRRASLDWLRTLAKMECSHGRGFV